MKCEAQDSVIFRIVMLLSTFFFGYIDASIADTCFQWHMVAPAPMDMQVYSFLGARDFVNMVVMLEFEYLLVSDIDVCGSICL